MIPYARKDTDTRVMLSLAQKEAPASPETLSILPLELKALLDRCWDPEPTGRPSAATCFETVSSFKAINATIRTQNQFRNNLVMTTASTTAPSQRGPLKPVEDPANSLQSFEGALRNNVKQPSSTARISELDLWSTPVPRPSSDVRYHGITTDSQATILQLSRGRGNARPSSGYENVGQRSYSPYSDREPSPPPSPSVPVTVNGNWMAADSYYSRPTVPTAVGRTNSSYSPDNDQEPSPQPSSSVPVPVNGNWTVVDSYSRPTVPTVDGRTVTG
ncbi:hypothetical protein FS837_006115 [Tulasnella sp. UAMH 9824]|nr:hypothetical protein FS837_006115 [Tulasnella sp. UAMH 9824]